MILVRPDRAPEKVGSIFAPIGSLPQGHQPCDNPVTFMDVKQMTGDPRDTFTGTVVAIGPGDKHTPAASLHCSVCHQKRTYDPVIDYYVCDCRDQWVGAPATEDPEKPGFFNMPKRVFNKGPMFAEEVAEWDAGRYPMLTKVGDRVAFPRRPSGPVGCDIETGNCNLTIEGEDYLLFHEEQSALAIIGE